MSARICTRSFASRFESGSSMRKTCGWRTIARPIATRCRCPPESCFGLRSRYGVRSSICAAQVTRRCVSSFASFRSRRPNAMFSTPLKATSAIDPPDMERGAVRGQDAVTRVLAVHGLELGEGDTDRIVRRACREAEKTLLARLAHVRDRVAGHVHVAHAAVGERVARAAKSDELAVRA